MVEIGGVIEGFGKLRGGVVRIEAQGVDATKGLSRQEEGGEGVAAERDEAGGRGGIDAAEGIDHGGGLASEGELDGSGDVDRGVRHASSGR